MKYLLNNALKFTNNHGEIVFCTKETSREIIVQLKDSGPGINKEDLPYILEAFHRNKPKMTGHSLSLAAVKALVLGHGGRVSVNSLPGKGSVFTVRLPKQETAATP